MKNLQSLFKLAVDLNSNWSENEHIDWSDAEMLVQECKKHFASFQTYQITASSKIADILTYTAANDEWDSGVVANWPDEVIAELDSIDKIYDYRSDGDCWEVFGGSPRGDDWIGTVDTETVAKLFVASLNPKSVSDELARGNDNPQELPPGQIVLLKSRRATGSVDEEVEYQVDESEYHAALADEGTPEDALQYLVKQGKTQRIRYDTKINEINEEFQCSVTVM